MERPNNKVIAQAVTTLAVALATGLGLDFTVEQAGAAGVLIGAVVAYFVPDEPK